MTDVLCETSIKNDDVNRQIIQDPAAKLHLKLSISRTEDHFSIMKYFLFAMGLLATVTSSLQVSKYTSYVFLKEETAFAPRLGTLQPRFVKQIMCLGFFMGDFSN
jgi:hypothetical protein